MSQMIKLVFKISTISYIIFKGVQPINKMSRLTGASATWAPPNIVGIVPVNYVNFVSG